MCGIAGLVVSPTAKGGYETGPIVARMVESLIHRGPDQSGSWVDEGATVALGHRRLSIQDLSENGRQPMHSASGQFVISFNGEIYNFLDLRILLEKEGTRFRGHSDTEVLLEAIANWGIDKALEQINGMFAFALFDRKQRRLYLVRDRIGEKPLYFGTVHGVLYFASELKAIRRALGSTRPALNEQALTSYLNLGYIPAPHSIYDGFQKLLPGHYLSLLVDRPITSLDIHARHQWDTSTKLKRYWSLRDVYESGLQQPFPSAAEAIETLEDALTRSVREKLIADVKVGCFLSGGIDSSLVAAFAQRDSSQPIRTFTIGFEVQEFDEAKYAAEIARYIGSDHTELYVTERDCLDVIPAISTVYDEPFADSSQIPSILVANLAKKHVSVCLSGDGGDELFLGYNRYTASAQAWHSFRYLPRAFRTAAGAALQRINTDHWDRLYSLVNRTLLSGRHPQSNVGLKVRKLGQTLKQKTLRDAYKLLLRYCENSDGLTCYHSVFRDPLDDLDVLSSGILGNPALFPLQAQYWDQLSYLPDDNLVKVDRSTMAVSLESRLPLLDPRIIQSSWRMPIDMKMHGGVGKWPLRDILYRHVPKHLLDRPKMGFSVPVRDWLRGALFNWAHDLLFSTHHDYIDNSAVAKLWNQHQSGHDFSHILWTILMFRAWQNTY